MSITNSLPGQSRRRERLNDFLATLPTPIEELRDNYSRIAFFVYFLTIKEGEGIALKSMILQLFDLADIPRPSNADRDLQKMMSAKKIIPNEEGFRLHRKELEPISKMVK